ncbi:MAG: DUF4271 domain-containing protein [Bacteroidota bacterium]
MGKSILGIQRLFSFVLILILFTQNSDASTDLKSKWLLFDASQNSYVVATEETILKAEAVSLWLTRSEGSYKDFFLSIPAQVSWFIGEDLIIRPETDTTLRLDIDSLFVKELVKDSLFSTFYDKNRDWSTLETVILSKNESFHDNIKNTNDELILSRKERNDQNFFIISTSIILLLLGIFKLLNPKEFFYYFNVPAIIDFRPKIDPDLEGGLFSKSSFFFLIILSLTISTTLLFAKGDLVVLPGFLTVRNIYLTWISVAGSVLIILLIKMVIISFMCRLFSINKMGNLYMLEYIKLSTLVYFPTAVILFLVFFSALELSMASIFKVYLAFIVIRTIILFLKTKSTTTFTNLHLFSYLCTVDFIPMLIILNFFLKK